MRWLVLWLVSIIVFIAAELVGFLTLWWVVGGIGWLAIATFLLIWYWLAPTNRYWTFAKEGTAKIVIKGDAFFKALIQWEGYTFDDEYSVVPENTWFKNGEKLEVIKAIDEKIGEVIAKRKIGDQEVEQRVLGAKKTGQESHLLGGFRYYGFWPIKDIYIYWFKWSGVTEDDKVIHHPRELLDFVLLKDDTYWVEVEQAEDKNLLPLKIELVFTIRIINPRKALFDIQNWLEAVINRSKPAVRDFITQDEYANWIKKKADMGKEIFEGLEKEKLLDEEFKQRYGVEVRKIQVKDINPPEGYREKTLAPYLAEMDKQATIIKAEGEKKATVIRAEGEEERIEKVFNSISKFGDLGKLVRTLEAAERSPLAASLTVQAIPGLPDMLRGVFGKTPETISPQEFRRLRETVERLVRKMEEKK